MAEKTGRGRLHRGLGLGLGLGALLIALAAPASAPAAITFGDPSLIPLGFGQSSVATNDLNGDGNLDMIVTNYGHADVSVLLGDGTGSFSDPTRFPVGRHPTQVVIGYLNNDDDADIAVSSLGENDGSGSISVLLGDGTGSFGSATAYDVGAPTPNPRFELTERPRSVAIGDLNGDGVMDLASANYADFVGSVSVLLGTGTGSFLSTPDFKLRSAAVVAIGDLNLDEKPDLLMGGQGGVTVRLGTGTGLADPVTYPAVDILSGLAVGDVSGDGNPDVVASGHPGVTFDGDAIVLLGDGTGSLGTATTYRADTKPSSIAIGDLDADGLPDLAVANARTADASVFRGAGGGDFEPSFQIDTGNAPPFGPPNPGDFGSAAIADLNNDGALDLAVAIYDNDGGGSSGPLSPLATVLNNPAPVASPAVVTFPRQRVGTTSAAKTVTIANEGSAPLAISGISIDPAPSGDQGLDAFFSDARTCGSTLAPGASCTYSLRFAPHFAGIHQATLTVLTNAPQDPTVELAAPAVEPRTHHTLRLHVYRYERPATLSALLDGLNARVGCNVGCVVHAEIVASKRLAASLGLSTRRLGSGHVHARAATATGLHIPLTSAARAALSNGGNGTYTIRFTAKRGRQSAGASSASLSG